MTQFLQRTALVLVATGALGACSTTDVADAMRPNFPIRSADRDAARPASTPAPATPVRREETPFQARPAEAVDSRPLETLPPARSSRLAQAQPMPPTRAPAPVFETVSRRSVTGRVVEVEGPAVSYVVKKGDNLAKVAGKLDTTVEQLKDDNRLKKSTIRPGQTLKGPRSMAKAYVAGSGDTLAAIGKRFGVSAEALRAHNGLSRNAAIRSGQRLRLPAGYRDRGPITSSSRVQVEAPDEPTPVRRLSPTESLEQAYQTTSPRSGTRTVTTRTVTGKVVEIAGRAVTYEVRKGDNLAKVAKKLGTTVEQLRDDNGLKKKSTIQPGQTLRGSAASAKAYVVGSGDTLAAIGKRFGVSAQALAEENDLGRNATVRPGRKLRLPDGYRDRGPVTVTTRVAAEPAETRTPEPRYTPPAYIPPAAPVREAAPTPSQPRPYVPSSSTPVPRPWTPPPGGPPPGTPSAPPMAAPVAAPPVSDAQISQLGRGRFIWPARGEVISDFGLKSAGQRNDGLNIRASLRDAVRAAAAGDAVDAGDQVPGFGNLVLVKHADGWVTAYGHLSRVEVKMQQKVDQGQQIGQAGSTGGVPEPQLHFEIRYAPSPLERARPIDPKLVLPR
ncbi:MAG: LysM peptidoglycan-binding domain-containing protein [Phenylobacterium sp.]